MNDGTQFTETIIMVFSVEMLDLLGEIRKMKRLNRFLLYALVILSLSISLMVVFFTVQLQASSFCSLEHFRMLNTTAMTRDPIDIGQNQSNITTEGLSGQTTLPPNGFTEYSHSGESRNDKLWGCYDYHEGMLGTSRVKASAEVQERLKCSKRLPGVWIIGVKKCGSQMLTGLLDLHPKVVSSIYLDKTDEMFLDKIDFTETYMPLTTPSEIGLFDMVGLQNRYDVLRHIVENITTPETRFIIILNDPVKRAISDYTHCRIKLTSPKNKELYHQKKHLVWDVRNNKPSQGKVTFFREYRIANSFEQSVLNGSGEIDLENGLIDKGIYLNYVTEILTVIPRERLLVVDGKKFVSTPWEVLEQTENFLGIPHFLSKNIFRKKGDYYCPALVGRPDAGCIAGKGRKKPHVHRKVMKKLNALYRPYNRKLRTLLNSTFSW